MTTSLIQTTAPCDHEAALATAYAFAQSMLGRADGAMDFGLSPFWHGWALCEAFLAGARWQRIHEKEIIHANNP